MKISVLPKFLFEDETLVELKDKGIKLEEGVCTLNKYKVPAVKFYNLDELEVINYLYKDSPLNENLNEELTDAERNSYGARVSAILFLQIRKAMSIKDSEKKVAVAAGLLAAINSLAQISMPHAKRFIPLVRSISS